MSTSPDRRRTGENGPSGETGQHDPSVLDGIGAVVAQVVGTGTDGGTTPTPLHREDRWVQDLRVDSLSMVEVLEGTAARFGVVVRDEDTRGLVTVGDLADLVARQRRGA